MAAEVRVRMRSPTDARKELRQLCVEVLRSPEAARDVAPLLARVVLELLDVQAAGAGE